MYTYAEAQPFDNVLQYVAACCSVLQCVAVCCRMLQCVECVAINILLYVCRGTTR